MNTNIFQAVHTLALSLDKYFEGSPFLFKGSENNTSFAPAFPMIYEFCVPPEDRNASGYPCNCPAICIVVEELSVDGGDMMARIALHIAVCNPATTDAETVEGTQNKGFEYIEGAGYTQDKAYTDLYVSCLRLGEETLVALKHAADEVRLENIVLSAPEVSLPDFPYANCVLTCDYKYQKSFRSVSPNIAQYL